MENKASLTLHQTLEQYPWRLLLFIARRRDLSLSSTIAKAELVSRLELALTAPGSLHTALFNLTPTAYELLTAIIAAGGQIPLRHLLPRYGPLRPPRQTPGHYGADPAIKSQPLSPLEALRAVGLAFENRADQQFHIPPELLHLLPQPAPNTPPQSENSRPPARPSSSAQLTYNLTCFLALLHKTPPRLLHRRWLPPWFLKEWGQHCVPQSGIVQPGSELKTNRRRFLHFLASQAGLLSGAKATATGQADVLSLSPAAWRWLIGTPAEQYQTLWQAWQQSDAVHWQQFQLPGAEWLTHPAQLLAHLQAALRNSDAPFIPDHWSATLAQRRLALLDLLPAGSRHPTRRLQETLSAILTGPLRWLGIVCPVSTTETVPVQYQVTAFGHRCLAGHFDQVDAVTDENSYQLTSRNLSRPRQATLTLTPRPCRLPAPSHLFTAISSGTLQLPPAPNSAHGNETILAGGRYTLTASTFVAALHQGPSAAALVEAITRLADRPLTAAEHHLLQHWAELANRVTIRPALLLETDQPEIITRLSGSRRGRAAIHRTHSPRLVELDPSRLPALVRRLTEQTGVPPQLITGSNDPASFTPAQLPAPVQWWVAARVYQALGQLIPLPLHLPGWQLEQLAEQLTPEQLAAAEVAVTQTLDALQQIIDGWAAHTPWPNEGLPVESSLTVINQALHSGQPLELTYYAASSNRLTQRIVEPYRLEWRGDTPYLIGFCHHAQSERTFRLDRIQQIATGDNDSDGR